MSVRSIPGRRGPVNIVSQPTLYRRICLRCIHHNQTEGEHVCEFDSATSSKCKRCRQLKSACESVPFKVYRRANELLELQKRLRTEPISNARKSLRANIKATAQIIIARVKRLNAEERLGGDLTSLTKTLIREVRRTNALQESMIRCFCDNSRLPLPAILLEEEEDDNDDELAIRPVESDDEGRPARKKDA